MDNVAQILFAFERHAAEGIMECFANGVDPNMDYEGKPLVYALINMYARGPLFKSCMKVFVDDGLIFPDKVLLAVLLDDAAALETELAANKNAGKQRYILDCTFTPLYEATLLHICAEYNHRACAAVLVQHGADVNAVAGIDEKGFGGQTPIFHTVNQHDNRCLDMMQFLLANNANLQLTVKGLIWGKGYSWETFIPAVNPVSYAMMGLLRQFQRTEAQIYAIVSLLMKAAYGIDYAPGNIPNKYLAG